MKEKIKIHLQTPEERERERDLKVTDQTNTAEY